MILVHFYLSQTLEVFKIGPLTRTFYKNGGTIIDTFFKNQD